MDEVKDNQEAFARMAEGFEKEHRAEFERPLKPYDHTKKGVFACSDITPQDVLYCQYLISQEALKRKIGVQSQVVEIVEELDKTAGDRFRRTMNVLGAKMIDDIMNSQINTSLRAMLSKGLISTEEIMKRMGTPGE